MPQPLAAAAPPPPPPTTVAPSTPQDICWAEPCCYCGGFFSGRAASGGRDSICTFAREILKHVVGACLLVKCCSRLRCMLRVIHVLLFFDLQNLRNVIQKNWSDSDHILMTIFDQSLYMGTFLPLIIVLDHHIISFSQRPDNLFICFLLITYSLCLCISFSLEP
jgi:hypothetical protein